MAKNKKSRQSYYGNCRLKIDIIKKIISKRCTSHEWNVLLYVALRQNEFGQAKIYYKDVIQDTNISKTHFYEVLTSLNQKNIINIVNDYNNMPIYWTVEIIGNTFLYADDYKAFVNINRDFLYSKEFLQAKSNVKVLVMKLLIQHREGFNQRLTKDKIMEWLSIVNKRSLYEYMYVLETWFKIKLTKNDIYIIELRGECETSLKSQREIYLYNKILYICRKFKVNNVTAQKIKEIIVLLGQYGDNLNKAIMAFSDIIIKDKDKDGEDIKRSLEPALIHDKIKRYINKSEFSTV